MRTSSHRKREEKVGFDYKMLVVKVSKLTWARTDFGSDLEKNWKKEGGREDTQSTTANRQGRNMISMSQESRIYRVNPFCPSCGEEHVYYDIEISEEEQKIVDDYYEQHKNETTWFLLLSPDMIPMGVTTI